MWSPGQRLRLPAVTTALRSHRALSSLPPHTRQIRVPMTSGRGHLELLTAERHADPAELGRSSLHCQAPLLLVHGGFHAARCFRNFLPFLASQGVPSYAVSLRGHGDSFRPANPQSTPVAQLAEDLRDALRFVAALHADAPPPVLAGHSAGGGLAQIALKRVRPWRMARTTGRLSMAGSPSADRLGAELPLDDDGTRVEISGLILMASFPPSGGLPVMRNWLRLDPMLPVRFVSMRGHPRAPLATPELVHRAFFSAGFPRAAAEEVFNELEDTESTHWPAALTVPFADVQCVLDATRGNVAVFGGAEDKLMTPNIVADTARAYGVREEIVAGAGHDLMLDVTWEAAAARVLDVCRKWSGC
jgi:pimeloyl-ACP methyl ester carboxylesterase